MDTNVDILLGDDNDLVFANGDIAIGDGNIQNVMEIIRSFPGFFKQYPLLGVGLYSDLNADGITQSLQNRLSQQLQSDGYSSNAAILTTDTTDKIKVVINV